MAELSLNTSTSIVDFLKSQGLPSDFTSRRKLYGELGFEPRLGSFVGSSSQNLSLLKQLQSPESLNQTRSFFGLKPVQEAISPYSSPESRIGLPDELLPGYKPPETNQGTQDIFSSLGLSGLGQAPSFSSAQELGIPEVPTIEGILGQLKPFNLAEFLKTPEAQLKQDIYGAEKESINVLAAQKQKQTRDEFERRGLFMSGMREGEELTIQQAALADKLGVDRKLAGYLIDKIESVRKESIDEAEKLMKEAMANKKDALDRLEKIGFTVIGERVLPTLDLALKGAALVGQKRDDARAILNTVIQQFGGLSFDQLPPQAQAQLEEQARLAGFPIGILKVGLATLADKRLLEQAKQHELQYQIQLQNLAIREASTQNSAELRDLRTQMLMLQLQNMTAVSPGQIINAATGIPAKTTQIEAEMLSRSQQAKELYIPQLKLMLKDVSTGALKGKLNRYTATTPLLQYLRDEDLSMFNALASYFSQQIVYMNSGKQINPEEMKRLSQSLPNAELTVGENLGRLNQFGLITNDALTRYMRLKGWGFATEGSGGRVSVDATAILDGILNQTE